MAISFEKIKKIELKNYLINILLIVILFGALYFLRIRFLKEISIESPRVIKKVRVDFNSLENQKEFLEKLNPYEEIPKFEGEKGRENPFLPY
jgi:type II secretory pathway component PulC